MRVAKPLGSGVEEQSLSSLCPFVSSTIALGFNCPAKTMLWAICPTRPGSVRLGPTRAGATLRRPNIVVLSLRWACHPSLSWREGWPKPLLFVCLFFFHFSGHCLLGIQPNLVITNLKESSLYLVCSEYTRNFNLTEL